MVVTLSVDWRENITAVWEVDIDTPRFVIESERIDCGAVDAAEPAILVVTEQAVRWQSGRMRRSRKPLNLQGFREFESHPHRQKIKDLAQ